MCFVPEKKIFISKSSHSKNTAPEFFFINLKTKKYFEIGQKGTAKVAVKAKNIYRTRNKKKIINKKGWGEQELKRKKSSQKRERESKRINNKQECKQRREKEKVNDKSGIRTRG